MPEYLAPGVYVEDNNFRPRSIEGVSTSTTAFVGATRKGPLLDRPEIITNFGEFKRIYGGLNNLSFAENTDSNPGTINYLAHAAHAFFNNGGKCLYVARTFSFRGGNQAHSTATGCLEGVDAGFTARSPGSGLNGTITLHEKRTQTRNTSIENAPAGSLVLSGGKLFFKIPADGNNPIWKDPHGNLLDINAEITAELITINIETQDSDGQTLCYENLGLGESHPLYLGSVLAQNPKNQCDILAIPYIFTKAADVTPFALYSAMFEASSEAPGETVIKLRGGNDGNIPVDDGSSKDIGFRDALVLLEDIEEISIIAAPGHSVLERKTVTDVQRSLISHAERMKYRFAVLDPPENQTFQEIRAFRNHIDSSYAALYYPWVRVTNPLSPEINIPKEIVLPPSGFLCGIYARNDITWGVWKIPANQVILGILGFECDINHDQQEVLNSEGINCLRFFPGRGHSVWGARTASSDSELREVNVCRYMIYLVHSISRGTQWAVFEPNGKQLWSKLRNVVSTFLRHEWRSGALLGNKPEQAFYVKCGHSTNIKDEVVCDVGVALVKPAEFIIFRIALDR